MLLLLTFLLFLIMEFYFSDKLPDVVASNFNVKGKPESFMSRENSLYLQIAVIVIIDLLFLWFSGKIFRIKDKWINIPNKEYHLSPERRTETLNYLAVKFLQIGILMNLYLLIFNWDINRANSLNSLHHSWLLYVSLFVFFILAAAIPFQIFIKLGKRVKNEK